MSGIPDICDRCHACSVRPVEPTRIDFNLSDVFYVQLDPLNIAGSEWIIIVFAALILILGTNKLPEAARKLGKASYEFNKAKKDMENQMSGVSGRTVEVSGPVKDDRQKFETIAKSIGVDPAGMSTAELRGAIASKMGGAPDKGNQPDAQDPPDVAKQ